MNWPPGLRELRRVRGNSALSSFATSPTLQSGKTFKFHHVMAGRHIHHSILQGLPL